MFEDFPADDELENSYLSRVKECEIFILILGRSISDPVLKEFETARKYKKPILVFLKNIKNRNKKVEKFIKSLSSKEINIKYQSFSSRGELQRKVLLAVGYIVKKYYERYLDKQSLNSLIAFLLLLETNEEDIETILSKFDESAKEKIRMSEKPSESEDRTIKKEYYPSGELRYQQEYIGNIKDGL